MTFSALKNGKKTWDMNFNPSKCQVVHVTRLKTPLRPSTFFMIQTWIVFHLQNTSDDLSWSTHIYNITKNANQTLGFLKGNIRVYNKDLKSVAYKTLVRPQLEYTSTYGPHPPTPPQTHTLSLIYRKWKQF